MDTKSSNVSFMSNSLRVVVVSDKVRFPGEWFCLFCSLDSVLESLPPSSRATLLDMLALGRSSKEGVVCVPLRSLYGYGISRANRFRAISLLEREGLVARGRDGLIYVSPEVAYRGKPSRWYRALEFWKAIAEVDNGQ
jgi:hypothetical protein